MHPSSLLLLLLSLASACLAAQYRPPLRGPLLITGTFGELRSDHFHGGLDFRGAVGTPVYAVNDGYVSRIKISGGGYGQGVYIDHPDGKRSVYGHMEVLAPELLDTIRALQYARESFEIDLQLDSTAFPVTRGQQIGGVGNRGFSFGPHLHFEIRDAATDAPLNPLSLGFPIPDTRLPQLRQLRVYELPADAFPPVGTSYDLLDGSLPDTIRVSGPRVAFGLKAYDRQNSMPNWNGIYSGRMLVDSVEAFSFVYDRIPFEKTEYLNALTDFPEWKRNTSWFYLLYALTPNALFWRPGSPEPDQGIVRLQQGQPRTITVAAGDFAGNSSAARFVVLWDGKSGPTGGQLAEYQYFLPAGEPSIIDTGGMRLELGADALYRDLPFRYARLADDSEGYLSDTHQLQDRETPLHGRASLHLRPRREIPDDLREKVYVAQCGPSGAATSVGGDWEENGWMLARIKSFGDFVLRVDTVPPVIRGERFGTDLRRAASFSVRIEEESGGGLRYRATVDGAWILMEYDAKSGRLTHTFEEGRIAGGGMHQLELTVTDERGNEQRFSQRFRR